MNFIDKRMYTEKSSELKFVYNKRRNELYNKPYKITKKPNNTDFKLTHNIPYKVGDMVRIKKLEQMKTYYSTTPYGSIEVPASFIKEMYQYCEKLLEVDEVIAITKHKKRYTLKQNGVKIGLIAFSDEMLQLPQVISRF